MKNRPSNRINGLFNGILFGITLLSVAPACFSQEGPDSDDKKTQSNVQDKPKLHNEFFVNKSAHTLQMTAREYMRAHRYKRAIPLLQEAIKKDPNDVEIYILYAEALQEKLESTEDVDPALFNQVIKLWLKVLRNEVGMERGSSIKGISIENGAFGDEEAVFKAKAELKHLAGATPRFWETDDAYLKRVLKKANTTVTAKILRRSSK